MVVGVVGLALHLRGSFFVEQTLHNLVYTAPAAAPLAYTGLGFLLILNRTEAPQELAWGQWVVCLAAGGFVGNFVLTLCDHAQNGFFYPSEWIAVVAAAFGLSFLGVAAAAWRDQAFLRMCAWVLGAQVVTGVAGAVMHSLAVLHGPSESLWENVVHTAPLFAPLLCADLALLGAIGLWALAVADRPDDQAVASTK